MKQLNRKDHKFTHQDLNSLNFQQLSLNQLNQKQQYYDPAEWPRAVIGFSAVLIMLWVSIVMNWIWADSNNTKPHTQLRGAQEYTLYAQPCPKEYLAESQCIEVHTTENPELSPNYMINRAHLALSF